MDNCKRISQKKISRDILRNIEICAHYCLANFPEKINYSEIAIIIITTFTVVIADLVQMQY